MEHIRYDLVDINSVIFKANEYLSFSVLEQRGLISESRGTAASSILLLLPDFLGTLANAITPVSLKSLS